ncbi:unnamed protein product [Ectocarpus sp. 4 AP-2014]
MKSQNNSKIKVSGEEKSEHFQDAVRCASTRHQAEQRVKGWLGGLSKGGRGSFSAGLWL